MRIISLIKRYFNSSSFRFSVNSRLGFYRCLPDASYLKRKYYSRFQRKLSLTDPKSFNEKIQWLKLYDRKPEYTMMVDKYKVKDYVASLIGKEHIIPSFGVWRKFNEIPFDELPNSFVLKCTHDSGGLVICKSKDRLDLKKAKKKIKKSLKRNYYLSSREWPYKNVEPRILAEAFMENQGEPSLIDYKFYCFNGEPRFLYVSKGLEDHRTAQISFVTLNWEFAPFERSDFKPFDILPKKPKRFDEMIGIAKKLSEGIPFLRVDLYEINDQVYFSELTFSPCAGFMPFKDFNQDLELGKMIKLPCNECE